MANNTKVITTQQAMRYSRQISLQGFDLDKQEQLMSSRVLIIGMGGLGCAASQYLVASGLGSLSIVDDDTVELTNLQRQILHYETNIGDSKVDSAKASLQALNGDCEIRALNERLNELALRKLILEHDLVLDCCDNLATRNMVNDACYASKVPLVSGAAIRMEGQIFCVMPSLNSACYRCISRFFGEQSLSCVEAGVMSPLVGIVGACQALEGIKILTNFGQTPINGLQMYDAMTSQWQTFKVEPQHDCQGCR
ncbi:molybdopterin-synthase adenylyltransferase MoeB [Glaciecola sp. 2405UD65-10]|uniref:molybdopterin-synthase adenylyltransferase MoeB n=1 Tax=Glaciecola sp. 2405UD65-10 TaxID=3397244 RepID=UPI003B5AD1D6